MSTTPVALLDRVNKALDQVVDPCSVGRSVPAGLVDMGMVKSVALVEHDDGVQARVTLRLTAPGCHFQSWFTERVVDEVIRVPDVSSVEVAWSTEFDWSDDDMSASLKARLQAKRRAVTKGAS